MISHLYRVFPQLKDSKHSKTSEKDIRYNCIAWAARNTTRWWEPNPQTYWPPGVPRQYTLEAYAQAYATLGFRRCDSDDIAPEYEYVAIYVGFDGKPTHAARLKPNGMWTSKIGRSEDIEHELSSLDSDIYGKPVLFMCREWPE